MAQQVSDTASNRRDQIRNFAEILRNAPSKQKVFRAVYHGKKRTKTVQDISYATDFENKRVTEIAKPLAHEQLFEQDRARVDGSIQTVYRKIAFIASNKRTILQLARSKTKLEGYHTKTNPKVSGGIQRLVLRTPFKPKVRFIRIDDVKQFAKVKHIRKTPERLDPDRLPEIAVRKGILRLLSEAEDLKDWGGESNDVFSVKLNVRGRRTRGAFALKGPGQKGRLVPGKMGKNGDQIQRLFDSPADVFFVQYEGEIAESVIRLMEALAQAKALTHREVFFGVIDRVDTYRLRLAYPSQFKPK